MGAKISLKFLFFISFSKKEDENNNIDKSNRKQKIPLTNLKIKTKNVAVKKMLKNINQ